MRTLRQLFNWPARLIFFLYLARPAPGSADVLTCVNSERFVGKVIEERTGNVIFESDSVGRLDVPRNRIRELQRTEAATASNTNLTAIGAGASAVATNQPWQPPGMGKDRFDWVKLKSDEWLKGRLEYIQDRKVRFESDKLEELSFELKDVHYLYSGEPMFVKFDGRDQVYGTVIMGTNEVEVLGPEQVALPRQQLTGITPGGEREINFWSAKASIGFNLQAGNTREATLNASAELARRTPATQLLLSYLGNYSEAEGIETANNHRASVSYDVRLNRNWFFRPVQLEYYRDELANIAHRATGGVGVGYYLYDRDNLEWKVAAGPGGQYTRFATVEPGNANHVSTPAALFESDFEADITSRLTFIHTLSSSLTSEESGLYGHHMVATLEYEIKKSLDLNVSFVWDYLQNPQTEANGRVPVRSDLRLTFGAGVKF